MLGILLLALSLVQLSAAQQADDVDLTLNEQAHGGSIPIDDNNIWRHLAYAKPRNGTGKIDRKTFRSTQKCHLPAIKIYCDLILTKLNIDWTRVSFSDLRNSLYSGLAANLYSLLQHKGKASAPVDTITEANPEPIIKGNNKTLVPALPTDAWNVRERRSISTQVRLVNGGFPGEGRIEVFYNGTWGTVCDDGFDVNDARVICSMLGYTGEQPVPRSSAFYGVGIGTIWLDDLACSGTESSVFFCRPSTVGIHNCQHHEDAGVNCHPSSRPNNIRLINGTRAWIGRVEIMVGSSWGTVCDDGFSNSNARVVCRMLGYTGGNPTYRSSASYGQGTGTIWLDDVTCNGDEQNIFMCRHPNFGQHNCGHSEDVGVDCNPEEFPIPVRLTNSLYPWEGRLEVLYNGMWMSVCSNKFNSYAPRVVCRMLGYTSSPAVLSSSNFGQGTGSIWSDNLQCTGTEPTLSVCPRTSLGTGSCSHTQDVGIRCTQYAPTPVIRLTSSVYPWEGRVEVWNNGTWGTVCDNNFDVVDARVVCRMLGYTQYSPLVKPNALYGPGTGAIWFDGVYCFGTEKTIFQCGHRGLGIHSCSHFEDVGVNCLPTAPSLPLRLVNGNNYWSGRVEVWHNGSWGSVCNVGFDLTDARVVCKMLGYSREQPNIYNSSVYGSGTGYILLSNINCYGSESSLFQCSQSTYGINNCVHAQDVGINCQPSAPTVPVKLANGSFPWEGRVEVWYGGSWGSVCKYNFDATDAGVICSMLGFKGDQPFVHNNDIYGQATGNIWLDNVGCRGTENSIYQCPHNEFGSYTCSVRDVAGINCLPSAPSHVIQLINGTYPWEGRVEVWYNGQWGTICSDSFDIVDAVVVCRMLGFGKEQPNIYNSSVYGSGTGYILLSSINCYGSESSLFHCSQSTYGINNCVHAQDVGINCQPSAPTVPVKLANGSFPWEGHVEVWYGGSWGSVCKYNFDATDAGVICSMLGFKGDQPSVHNNDIYGQASGNIWLDNVGCRGTENSIYQCPHNDFGNYTCSVRDVAGINCLPSAPSHVIQLINGTYPWEGRVEVWYNGQWGTICSDSFDIVDAVVVCRMLGFRNSAPTVDKALAYGPGTGVILMDDVSCTGSEKNIYTCSHRGLGVHNCDHYKDVGINCQPNAPFPLVRLVNGSNPWEGLVEVWREGSWGTVCQDNFDVKDALVVCRMLGYTGDDPDVFNNNDYGNSNGPIWINDVSCNGSEASIFHCPHNNLDNYACEHFDDVGIKCLKNVTDTGLLVNQSTSSSSGTNAVYYVGGACAGIILILIVIIIVLKRNSQGNDNILYDKPEPNSQKVEDTYEDLNERNYNNLAFQASSDDVSRLPNPPQTKKKFNRAQPPPGKGAEGNPKNMSSVCTVDNIYTNTRNASDSGGEAIYQNISQS